MVKIRKCEICNTYEAESRDYRFIEGYGLQGKVLSCKWCRNLNDVALTEIIDDGIDPQEYYECSLADANEITER